MINILRYFASIGVALMAYRVVLVWFGGEIYNMSEGCSLDLTPTASLFLMLAIAVDLMKFKTNKAIHLMGAFKTVLLLETGLIILGMALYENRAAGLFTSVIFVAACAYFIYTLIFKWPSFED